MTMRRACLLVGVFLVTAFPASPARASGQEIRLPEPLANRIASVPHTPARVLEAFLGIPYRMDGVVNARGEYALFNAPETALAEPGLNCSGMVLTASRVLLTKNITVQDAIHDRLHDSGPDSPLGHDWDFGFDLIMNIAEGFTHAMLVPAGMTMPENLTGRSAPSFDLHHPDFASDLLPRIREDAFYLVSFSRHKTPDAPAHLHYHTAIIIRAGEAVWSYSATRNSRKTIRLNLATPQGLATFRHSFRNTNGSYKRLTIIEVTPH